MEILKPYREKIDDIDCRLVALLRERYDVIEAVGALKTAHDIPSVLQDRVDAVRDNAVARAKNLNLDPDFIYKLWSDLIVHACALEDTIKDDLKGEIS